MVEGSIAVAEIENSPEYQALLVTIAGKPERSMGDSVIPAEPPVWGDVKKQAQALLTDPPHLAVLVQLVKARARVDSFVGLQDSLKLLFDHLSSNWDEAHPLADADDEEDPYYERVNLLRELCDEPSFLKAIYSAPLVSARAIGTFSTRDIDIASGKIPGTEEEQARCQEGLVRGAFAESDVEALRTTLSACTELQTVCTGIQSLFDERAGAEHGLTVAALQTRITECHDRLAEYGSEVLKQGEDETDGSAASDIPTSASSSAAGTRLADRHAVCVALDRIIIYYMNHEPSSPVPVLVQRARDMVPKTFFDVLQELAPGERENLSGLLTVLTGNPLSYLIQDSYQRFLAGEVVAPLTVTHTASEPIPVVDEYAPESNDDSGVESGDDAGAESGGDAGAESGGDAGAESGGDAGAESGGDAGAESGGDAGAESGGDAGAESGGDAGAESGGDAGVAPGEDSVNVPAPQAVASSGGAGKNGSALPALQSRAAVMEVLNQVEAFFFQNEPSSPIPLIVAEVRKIVPKKFTDLVTELNSVLNPDAGQAD